MRAHTHCLMYTHTFSFAFLLAGCQLCPYVLPIVTNTKSVQTLVKIICLKKKIYSNFGGPVCETTPPTHPLIFMCSDFWVKPTQVQ